MSYDLFASPDTVKAAIDEAKRALGDGQIQKARALVETLGSEIQIRTSNIPLATYPDAIKPITPLIDAGKIDDAKAQLQAALGTLVVTTEVIQLSKLRAENLLQDAQVLAEKNDRTKEENDKLGGDLRAVGPLAPRCSYSCAPIAAHELRRCIAHVRRRSKASED